MSNVVRMRRLLAALSCGALLVLVPVPAASAADTDCLRTIAGLDLQTATIPQLQAAMAAGKLTSRQLVERYVARVAAFDPALNSVRQLHPAALAQADALDAERKAGSVRGPLHGIPILLKDNIGTNDMPTTAGSIALEGSVPLRDAYVTERLRAAGAVILGKTNLSEFANWMALGMPNGYSSLGGQVVNAHDGGDPSGSSSGSGVAGSMALAAGTFGTETSGSILSPSNDNGLVGIKPTVGLVSRAGILPLAPTFDTAGPMVRTVTDAALLLGAVAGPDDRDPVTAGAQVGDYAGALKLTSLEGARLGVAEDDKEALDSEERVLFDEALAAMEEAGATLVPMDSLPATSYAGLTEIAAIPNEFKYSLNRYLAEETKPDLRVKTLSEIIEFNKTQPERVKYGQNLLEASNATLGIYDEPTAIANRTAAVQGSRAAIDGALLAGDLDAIVAPGPRYANVGAAAGYPTVLVPIGYTRDGAEPLGVSFLGTAYTEPVLVGYAYAYEQRSLRRVAPTELAPDLVPASCAAAGPARPVPPLPPRPAPGPGTLPATGAAEVVDLAALGCLAGAVVAGRRLRRPQPFRTRP